VAAHLVPAQQQIADAGLASRVTFEVGSFDAERPGACDLLVLPLAFRGDRTRFYGRPPARLTAIHDWAWRAPPAVRGVRVSLLPKRINLVVDPTV